jgi:hypothetical protein
VRQQGADVERGRGPDADEPRVDELVRRVADQPSGDEDQRDPGPAEEARQVEDARSAVEAVAKEDGDQDADEGSDEGAGRADVFGRGGGRMSV